ncbi:MAG TPA: hypothetical protein VHE30_04150 [Polyangiaceae bacterium]|nr:hypothetical protein [Polyangiaceae bacterium]
MIRWVSWGMVMVTGALGVACEAPKVRTPGPGDGGVDLSLCRDYRARLKATSCPAPWTTGRIDSAYGVCVKRVRSVDDGCAPFLDALYECWGDRDTRCKPGTVDCSRLEKDYAECTSCGRSDNLDGAACDDGGADRGATDTPDATFDSSRSQQDGGKASDGSVETDDALEPSGERDGATESPSGDGGDVASD